MLPAPELLRPSAALLAGFVASFHCAGMCGPLACAIAPRSRADSNTALGAYHVCRVGAYGILGAVAGGLGRLPLALLPGWVLAWTPLLLAAAFLGLALHWGARWARPFRVPLGLFPAVGRLGRRSSWAGGALLGAATPLLPCGPLYFFLAVGLLAGTAVRGAELLVLYGIGTLPLLWLAQTQFFRIRAKLPARWLARIQVTLALVAAALAAWRLRSAGAAPTNSWLCF